MNKIDPTGYVVVDDFFGAPYVDVDEWLKSPVPHRYVHGGFSGTDTRFAFRFPPDELYQGRLYQPLEGANAGHEDVTSGPLGSVTGGPEGIFRLGGYVVESNMGHIGDVKDAKAGDDPTIYGWRAAAESARFSKYVAAQVLGAAPRYSYVYGGSGGARRSPLCLAYAPDVWDAAMPFMGDDVDGDYGDWSRPRDGTPNFAAMFNVQRVLGDTIGDVVDAMRPGGSGNPFAGLNTHQREQLAVLYKLGFPRGDEFMIAQPMGQLWLWCSRAERMSREDPYFERFWTEPGHVGFDQPEVVQADLIDAETTVARVLTANDLITDEGLAGPEFAPLRILAMVFGQMAGAMDLPMVVQLSDTTDGYLPGAGVRFLDGQAAGRQLYCMSGAGNTMLLDGEGEASNLRLTGVQPGDRVQFDNRAFLAYCYYPRHHIWESQGAEQFRLATAPIYEQYEQPELSPFMGVRHTGRFDGKMLWVQHTLDSSLWPSQGLGMKNNIEREVGPARARQCFRLRFLENAEHVPPLLAAPPPDRANNTWLIDYVPHVEQSLADLTAWVEDGIEPNETTFDVDDGKINLPASAKERGGIQPVVHVTANGAKRAEISARTPVNLKVHAEVPEGAGTIISVKWDLDGSGAYPVTEQVDGESADLTFGLEWTYTEPGTYFPTALVESHRDGNVAATSRRIPNLDAARVVVAGGGTAP
ncbi:MAG: hypothetical protein JWP83_3381 [Mycobacterium sp.]|uniref:hypothetical protein n=1 Tax=Mycobacterium sp. TaxID=1785 RepID=UPI00261FD596|nr:hypothetical protein [Mycobacterium sp.]MCW2662229.1 hypothetical protein [Mycobacterium sp.]